MQAVCFLEAGRTFVAPKPWLQGEEPKWVASEVLLPPAVRSCLEKFREQAQQQLIASGTGAAAS